MTEEHRIAVRRNLRPLALICVTATIPLAVLSIASDTPFRRSVYLAAILAIALIASYRGYFAIVLDGAALKVVQPFSRKQIDLERLTKSSGVVTTGQKGRESRQLYLEDRAGVTLRLDLDGVRSADRRRLLSAIHPYIRRPQVKCDQEAEEIFSAG